MVEPLNVRDLTWAVTTLLELVLMSYILLRKLYRLYPAFSAYVLATFFQGVLIFWSGRHWGELSMQYFNTAWSSQAAMICLRWLAVVEITRRVLAAYTGIWKLTSVILFILGISILIEAVVLSQNVWYYIVLNADRAVELCLAGFIVSMLVFARYYRLEMSNLDRQLVVGFCLFSCSWVILNSLFQGERNVFGAWWEFFQILSFLATLVVWIQAVRSPVEVRQPAPVIVLPPAQYGELSGHLNTRLNLLNDRLNELFRLKGPRR
jgi:hypothetical protein